MHDEGIGLGDLTRRLSARCPHDGQPIAAHLAVGLGQRTGRKQHALLLQTDHVFEVAWQMLGDRFGRRPALGEDDVELFTMRSCVTGSLPFAPAAYRAPSSPCTTASMARRPAAIKDRARDPTHSMPPFSCKQQEKNNGPGTTWRRWLSP